MTNWKFNQRDPLTARFSRQLGDGWVSSAEEEIVPMDEPMHPADRLVLAACLFALAAFVLILAMEWL